MEIALVISSLAGAATAATVARFPRNKNRMPLLGASSQIRAQIDALKIEKEILTKTISRLYQDGSSLSKSQRDRLLSKYQHQLGVILSSIEKLEEASKYPDLGPLGDGLMSLMDKKLSALDKRLAEMSAKMAVPAQVSRQEPPREAVREEPKARAEIPRQEVAPVDMEKLISSFAKPAKRLEITTLTEIPSRPIFDVPAPQAAAQVRGAEPPRQVQEAVRPAEVAGPVQKPFITEPIDIEARVKAEPPKLEFREGPKAEPERRKPRVVVPEPEAVEDDEDDLDSIKREIMKTLSKLEQAEVE